MIPRTAFTVAVLATVGCTSTVEIPAERVIDDREGASLLAARDYPTYRALHDAVVERTCGPRSGVCHNSKQYPDLHTPENMLAVVGRRCNELTADPTQIQDLCEVQGDWLVIRSGPDAGWRSRIGYVIDGTKQTPATLTLTLHDAPPHDLVGVDADVVRELSSGPEHLHLAAAVGAKAGVAQVNVSVASLPMPTRAFFVTPYTPGLNAQVFLGDPNRNGVFGADLGGAVIRPGAPSKSFLVLRILGKVQPQMPLANNDLSPAQIYALQCWIAQMAADGSNADGPIDYTKCPATFPP